MLMHGGRIKMQHVAFEAGIPGWSFRKLNLWQLVVVLAGPHTSAVPPF